MFKKLTKPTLAGIVVLTITFIVHQMEKIRKNNSDIDPYAKIDIV